MIKKLLGIIFILIFSVSISLAQESESLDVTYFNKGMNYFDSENYKTAILYFDSAIVANTENAEAYAFRGISKFSLELYNESIEDFDLALILTPGYAEIYYFRGLAKLEVGANKKACEDLYLAYDYGFKKSMKIIKNVCEEEKKP